MSKERKTKKLTCVITGKTTNVQAKYYEKKVVEAGSEKNLKETYVCKEAKALLKKGFTIEEICKALNCEQVDIPESMLDKIIAATNENLLKYKSIGLFDDDKSDPDVAEFIQNIKNI